MTLYERLRYRLRMLRLGLTIKPVAGGEETPEEKAAREKREAEEKEKREREERERQKPPWGDDKDFDAPRAWKLIQDLRGDLSKVKAERDELRDKVNKHEDASKSDQQKLTERTTGAEKRAADSEREAARLRIALKKGLTETQAKRLVGDSEEDLEKDADDLLASFKTEGDEGREPRRRPQESLRPGAAPSSEPEETNPIKLAEQVPRMY